jgi:hypothetical protein
MLMKPLLVLGVLANSVAANLTATGTLDLPGAEIAAYDPSGKIVRTLFVCCPHASSCRPPP